MAVKKIVVPRSAEVLADKLTDADRKRLSETEINKVWESFSKKPNDLTRNFLIEKYLHLVKYNAERIHVKLPSEVPLDDLMSEGVFGLMNAIDSFDLKWKVKFETYCAPRIRGSILDWLRATDWIPRLTRSRGHKYNSAVQSFEMTNGRPPSDEELVGLLGVNDEEFGKMKRDSSAMNMTSLDGKCYETDSNRDVARIDVLADPDGTNPLRDIQRKNLRELVTRGLTRAERLIVILYYFEEMTMKEIGLTLDLSESRVSQMHTSILKRLQDSLSDRSSEFERAEAG